MPSLRQELCYYRRMNNPWWRSFLPIVCCCLLSGCLSRDTLLNPALGNLNRVPSSPAKNKVEDLVSRRMTAGDVKHVSVYFQALPTGYWFGINEQDRFALPNLMKLFLMMGVLKRAETDSGLLASKVGVLDMVGHVEQTSVPEMVRGGGKLGAVMTVDDLLERMISRSDNNAMHNLVSIFMDDFFDEVFSSFGLDPRGAEKELVTVKQCMMAILSLYNSTYLSPAMSRKAIGYMLKSDFDSGLAAGLPPGLAIANKFGEQSVVVNGDNVSQLYDCGIIYYPGFPYLLGVMTRGDDMVRQQAVIREVSAIVYAEVDSGMKDAR